MNSLIKKIIVSYLIIWLILPSAVIASPPIEVDQSALQSQQAQIDHAQNEVPIVNLAAPTDAGVSKNLFRNYNVTQKGVVLNNSLEMGVSKLGGAMYANPQYVDRAADIVICEVNGGHQSQIQGYTEMFGKSAEFILANPSGIAVNGGGFINIPRATLTTGQTYFNVSGQLTHIDVSDGHITFGENGFNAHDLDYFDIVCRTAQLNGTLWGGADLTIQTGQNRFDYTNRTVDVIGDETDIVPEYGIDASALGAMVAGRIKLISTEQGVGVNTKGDMLATVDDIQISSKGDVLYSNINAKTNIQVTAKDNISQTTKSEAAFTIDLKADGKIMINGEQIKASDIALDAGDAITIEQTIQTEDDSPFSQSQSLQLRSGQDIHLINSKASHDHVQLDAKKDIYTLDFNIVGDQIVMGANHNIYHQSSDIYAKNKLNITSAEGQITIGDESMLISEDTMRLKASQDIVNENSLILARNTVGLHSTEGSIHNQKNAIIETHDELLIRANDAFINDNGDIVAVNQIDITAKDIQNESGFISSQGVVRLMADGAVQNSGVIVSEKNIEIQNEDNQTQAIKNTGVISAAEKIMLNATAIQTIGSNDVDTGVIANGDISIIAGENGLLIDNANIQTNAMLSIQSEGDIHLQNNTLLLGLQSVVFQTNANINNVISSVLSKGDIALNCEKGQFFNSGIIESLSNLSIDAASVENQGSILSHGELTIFSKNDVFNAGLCDAGTTLNIHSGGMIFNSGDILAAQSVVMTANQDVSNIGYIDSGASILIETDSGLQNTGDLFSDLNINLAAKHSILNSGQMSADQSVLIQSTDGDIENQAGGINANGQILLTAITGYIKNKAIAGKAAVIEAMGDLKLAASALISNENGEIYTAKALDIIASKLINDAGDISAVEDIVVTVEKELNNTGTIAANKTMIVSNGDERTEKVENEGLISAGESIQIDADQVINKQNQESGGLIAGDDIDINAEEVLNDNGTVQSEGKLSILSMGDIVNQNQSTIIANKNINIQADADLINLNAQISAKEGLVIDAGTVENIGQIETESNLTIKTKHLQNKGLLKAIENLIITAGDEGITNIGNIESNQNADITSIGTIHNIGKIAVAGQLNVDAHASFENNGEIITNDTLAIISATSDIKNTGIIVSNTNLSMDASQNIINDTGTIKAVGKIVLTALNGFIKNKANDAKSAVIEALDTLTLFAKNSVKNEGGEIYSSKTLQIEASDLINDEGEISVIEDMGLIIDDTLNNSGTIAANKSINSHHADKKTARIKNTGLISAGENLSIHTNQLINKDNIEFGGLISGQHMRIVADDLENDAAKIYSSTQLDLDASSTLLNQGIIEAQKTLILTAYDINNQLGLIASTGVMAINVENALKNSGEIIARESMAIDSNSGIENTGEIYGSNAVDIHSIDLTNDDGKISAVGNMSLTIENKLRNTGVIATNKNLIISNGDEKTKYIENIGLISAGNDITINTEQLLNQGGDESGLITTGNLTLNIGLGGFLNDSGSVQSVATMAIKSAGQINNQNNSLIVGQSNILIEGGSVLINKDSTIYADKRIEITQSAIENNGQIEANNDINIKSTEADIKNTGEIITNQHLTVIANQNIENQGSFKSNGHAAFTALNGYIKNTATAGKVALIETFESLKLIAKEWILNENAALYADKKIDISASDLLNTNAQISAIEDVQLSTSGGGVINNKSRIQSQQVVTIQGNGDIINENDSLIIGNAGVLITGDGHLKNQDSLIYSDNDIVLNQNQIENSGWIESVESLKIAAEEINNTNILSANNDLYLQIGGDGLHNSGSINSNSAININSNTDITNEGTIVADSGLSIIANKNINNFGKMNTNHSLELISSDGNIENKDALIKSNGLLILTALNGYIKNKAAVGRIAIIEALGALTLAAKDLIFNENAEIYTANHLDITAADFTNNTGAITAVENIELAIKNNIINTGMIAANKRIVISNGDEKIKEIQNTGLISAGELIQIDAEALENSGKLDTGLTLDLNLNQLTNSGVIQSDGDADINCGERGVVNQGQIKANKDLILESIGAIDNQGELIAVNAARIQSQSNIENAGSIIANQLELDSTQQSILNDGGEILSDLDLHIKAKSDIKNINATIQSNQDIIIESVDGTLINHADQDQISLIQAVGGLTLKAKIAIKNISAALIASKQMQLITHLLANINADIFSKETLSLNIANTITNSGDIASNQDILAHHENEKMAKVDNSGKMQAETNINVKADSFDNSGSIQSKGELSIIAASLLNKDTNQKDKGLVAGKNIELDIGKNGFKNDSGKIKSNAELVINSKSSVYNSKESELIGLSDVAFNLEKSLYNDKDSLIYAGGDLTFQNGNDEFIDYFSNKGQVESLQNVWIYADVIHNSDQILAGNTLDLHANYSIYNSGHLYSKDKLTILSDKYFKNSGIITSEGRSDIRSYFSIINDDGVIESKDDLKIQSEGYSVTNNNNAIMASNGCLTINANKQINNKGSLILSGLAMTLDAGDTISNKPTDTHDGVIKSLDTLTIKTNDITNFNSIEADNALTLESSMINNKENATISTLKAANYQVSSRINNQGQLLTGDTFIINPLLTLNNSGLIFSNSDLSIDVTHLSNNQTNQASKGIIAGGDLSISHTSSETMDNQGGYLSSNGDLSIISNGIINNNKFNDQMGLIQSGGLFLITAESSLNNNGSLIESTYLSDTKGAAQSQLSATVINNNMGQIKCNDNLKMESPSIYSNAGLIFSLNDIDIKANRLNNSNTKAGDAAGLIAGGNLTLLSDENVYARLDNYNGHIFSGQNLDLYAKSIIYNREGDITSLRDAKLSGAQIINNSGKIMALKTVQIDTGYLDNNYKKEEAQGLIYAGDHLIIEASSIDNKYSSDSDEGIWSGNQLEINASYLDNEQGTIGSKRRSALNFNMINNEDGVILASLEDGGASDFSTNSGFYNTDGKVYSKNELTLTFDHYLSLYGDIFTEKSLVFQLEEKEDEKSMNNYAVLYAKENVTLLLNRLLNRNIIHAGHDLTLQSNTLENYSELTAGQDLDATVHDLRNYNTIAAGNNMTLSGELLVNGGYSQKEALIFAGNDLDIYMNQVNNYFSDILSLKDMRVQLNQNTEEKIAYLNNNGGLIDAGGKLTIKATDLFNQSELNRIYGSAEVSQHQYYWNLVNSYDPTFDFEYPYFSDTKTIYNNRLDVENIEPAVIRSHQDMSINADTISNKLATIYSGANMDIDCETLENESLQLLKSPEGSYYNPSEVYYGSTFTPLNGENKVQYIDWQDNVADFILDDSADLPDQGVIVTPTKISAYSFWGYSRQYGQGNILAGDIVNVNAKIQAKKTLSGTITSHMGNTIGGGISMSMSRIEQREFATPLDIATFDFETAINAKDDIMAVDINAVQSRESFNIDASNPNLHQTHTLQPPNQIDLSDLSSLETPQINAQVAPCVVAESGTIQSAMVPIKESVTMTNDSELNLPVSDQASRLANQSNLITNDRVQTNIKRDFLIHNVVVKGTEHEQAMIDHQLIQTNAERLPDITKLSIEIDKLDIESAKQVNHRDYFENQVRRTKDQHGLSLENDTIKEVVFSYKTQALNAFNQINMYSDEYSQAADFLMASLTPPDHDYEIETDEGLTNLEKFMNSSYLLERIGVDEEEIKEQIESVPEAAIVQVTVSEDQDHSSAIIKAEDIKLEVTDGGITNEGSIQAEETLVLEAEEEIINEGIIESEGDIELEAEEEIINEGIIESEGDIELEAEAEIINEGIIESEGDIEIEAEAEIINEGIIESEGDIEIEAEAEIINEGIIESEGDIALIATQNINNNHGVVFSLGHTTLIAEQAIINDEGSIDSHQSLLLKARDAITNVEGEIKSRSTIMAESDGIINNALGNISGVNAVVLTAKDDIINDSGSLALNHNASIDQTINQTTITGLILNASGDLHNNHGNIESEKAVMMIADKSIKGFKSTIKSDDSIMLASGETIYNYNANLDAKKQIQLSSDQQVQNSDATIRTDTDLIITATNGIANQNANLSAKQNLVLQSDERITDKGSNLTASMIDISAKSVVTDESTIQATDQLAIQTTDFQQHEQADFDAGDLFLTAKKGIYFNDSDVDASQGAMIDTAGDFNLYKSGLRAKKDSVINALNVSLDKSKLQSDESLYMRTGGDILNRASDIGAKHQLFLDAGGSVKTQSLTRRSKKGQYGYRDKRIQATMKAGEQGMVIKAQNDIVDVGGLIKSEGDINLNAANDILFTTLGLDERKATLSTSRSGFLRQDVTVKAEVILNTKQHQSQLIANGNLITNSGNDTLIDGAKVTVKKTASMSTLGNFLVKAVDELKKTFSASKTNDLTGHNRSDGYSESSTAKAAVMKIGENLIVNAKKDIAVVGSNLDVANMGKLTAEGDVLIGAAKDKYIASSDKSGGHWLGASGRDSTDFDLTHQKSVIQTGDGFFIDAKAGAAKVFGSDLSSDQSIEIKAASGVDILSAEDKNHHQSSSYDQFIVFKTKDDNETFSTDQIVSSIYTKENLTLDTDQSIKILGSQITTDGDATFLAADKILIASALELKNKQETKEDMVLAQFDITLDRSGINFNTTQKGTGDQSSHESVVQQKSILNIRDNLIMKSKNDIDIVAVDITAGADATIESEAGNVSLTGANEYQAQINANSELKTTLTQRIANSMVEAAHQVVETVKDLTKKEDNTDAIASGVQAASKGVKAAKTIENVAKSAGDAATFGFYYALQVKTEKKEEKSETNINTAINSNIRAIAGDLNIKAKNDITIDNADLIADQGDMSFDSKNLRIKAGKSTTSIKDSYSKKSVTTTLFSTSAAGDVGNPTVSDGHANSERESVTYQNSNLLAKNGTIKVNTKADLHASGANIIGDYIDFSGVKGDLFIESLQDTHQNKSKSSQTLVGSNIGYEGSNKEGDIKWVSDQSEIIGLSGIKIKANTLTNKGAVIANRAENGIDQGNLELDVNEIIHKTIKDHIDENTNSVGIIATGVDAMNPTNSDELNIKYANNGKVVNRNTNAIIGKSKVWINNLPKESEPLNRDINRAQEYTKNEATGGINVEVSLDKRMLTDTKDYIKDTAKTVTDLAYNKETGVGGNIAQAAENMAKAAKNLGKAAIETITGKGKDGVLADYQGTIRNQELALQTKVDENLKEALSNMATKPEKAEDALEKLAAKAVRANGVDEDSVTVKFYRAEDGNMGGHKDGKIYINLAYQDGSQEKLMTVLGDELSHYVDQKNNRPDSNEDQSRQAISTDYGNDAGMQTVGYIGIENNQSAEFQDQVSKLDFTAVNEAVANTDGMEHRLFINRDKIVATDQVADDLVVEIRDAEANRIKSNAYKVEGSSGLANQIRSEFQNNMGVTPRQNIADKENSIIKVSKAYQSSGQVYDLNKTEDFNQLKAKTDMSYKQGGTEVIYYQNGVQNDMADAKQGVRLISEVTGIEESDIGIINNKTAGKNKLGLAQDLIEYAGKGLETKDVINAKMYEDIAKNGDDKNTIILFSAGNKDAQKAMDVLALENKSLENKVEFISIGSPVKQSSLEKSASRVNATVVGQYNDWKDPVANSKKWIAGATGLAVGGVIVGAGVGAATTGQVLNSATSLETIFNVGLGGSIGGSIGFGTGKYSLKKHHSLESYLKRDISDINTQLKQLSK